MIKALGKKNIISYFSADNSNVSIQVLSLPNNPNLS